MIVLLLILLCGLELVLARIKSIVWQETLGMFFIILLISLSLSLLIIDYSVFSILVYLISIFRIVNIARLLKGDKQPDYLENIYNSSVLYLALYLIIIFLVERLVFLTKFSGFKLSVVLVIIQSFCTLVIGWSLIRSNRKMAITRNKDYVNNQDLPSLCVALPARNETMDLEACLDSLAESDYPKLEILVLDDCSQTKKTPEIIKRYAQAGIRFIEGKVPPDSWAAKNYAYEQLVDQSSSEIILFCGVDARFNKDSLRLMVEVLINKKKRMISFLPLNIDTGLSYIQKLTVQPWRYFWEVAMPRRQLNRPAVISTCWLIYANELKAYGGFKAVARNILPERYFARQLVKKNQGYSFMRTFGSDIYLRCQKDYQAQLSTSARTLYPMVGSRIDTVLLVSVIKFTILVLPLHMFVFNLIIENWWIAIISFINFIVIALCYASVSRLAYGKRILGAVILMPFLALFDIYQTIHSMWLYEFREVIWKDRNVCIPVMRELNTISNLEIKR